MLYSNGRGLYLLSCNCIYVVEFGLCGGLRPFGLFRVAIMLGLHPSAIIFIFLELAITSESAFQ